MFLDDGHAPDRWERDSLRFSHTSRGLRWLWPILIKHTAGSNYRVPLLFRWPCWFPSGQSLYGRFTVIFLAILTPLREVSLPFLLSSSGLALWAWGFPLSNR